MRSNHPSSSSMLARALEPFVTGLWILFCLWTVVVALVWATHFGEAQVHQMTRNRGLSQALILVLGFLDSGWITLGAANVYAALAKEYGLPIARRWALILLVSSAMIAACSARTGLPLGPIHFTRRLGMQLAGVPIGVPLLWFGILAGARQTALRFFPKSSHAMSSFIAAGLALVTDFNLEPLAWRVRAFWLWYPGQLDAPKMPPWQNAVTWMGAGFLLLFAMRETRMLASGNGASCRPALVLLMMNVVFGLAHLSHALR